MPINEKILEQIKHYLDEKHIPFKSSSLPSSFTLAAKNPGLVIKIEKEEDLKPLLEKVNTLITDENRPCISIIGGGRNGENNSYSINDRLWNGTDIFIQLAWNPTIKIEKEESDDKEKKETFTCRISPNITLKELNKKLFEEGYHCQILHGVLPFMSFAGGLGTGSHTSSNHLSDVVQGIQLLLPNGKMEYFKKGDRYFDLICKGPHLGMLGTIMSIDIRVEKGSKKLKRTIEVSMPDQKDPFETIKPSKGSGSNCYMFSSANGKIEKMKTTRFDWVDGKTKDKGKTGSQVGDQSWSTTTLAPTLATHHAEMFSKVFERATMVSEDLVIRRPDAIMGPESTLAGNITEVGIFFPYDEKTYTSCMKRIMELLKTKHDQGLFPVNTALFIRFPKCEGLNHVAVDFVSLGKNSPGMKSFINEVMSYLESEDIDARAHYGKSYSIEFNKEHWEKLKKQYETFYEKYNLDKNGLNQKIHFLEQPSADTPIKKETIHLKEVVEHYKKHCQQYEKYLENDLEEQLKINYPDSEYQLTLSSKALFDAKLNISTIEKISKEQKTMQSDTKLQLTLKKYSIIQSLKESLENKDKDDSHHKKIERFHRIIDRERHALNTQRDHVALKWLGVLTAGVFGIGVFSYWTVAKTHAALFSTKAKEMVLDKVDITKERLYEQRRSFSKPVSG